MAQLNRMPLAEQGMRLADPFLSQSVAMHPSEC